MGGQQAGPRAKVPAAGKKWNTTQDEVTEYIGMASQVSAAILLRASDNVPRFLQQVSHVTPRGDCLIYAVGVCSKATC
jgi:hypothetical protein